ncbi:MAG: DUF1553 domain-containing protein [Bryobacterales bacterium]|nr:DUF1553 domain-containing protein [Bryobacterales bacterium]
MLIAVSTVFGARLDYNRDVRPILAENCFHCHGQDSKNRIAGLRLDTPAGAARAVTPGKPEASSLYARISAEQPVRRMPPVASNRSLTAEQIATLKRWIEEGAPYAQHWSFTPPVRPEVPAGENAIDALVRRRLAADGLQLNRAASPGAWLRRVSLDLTGLPPTPAEVDAFVADPAYERAVDRLLASPRYGERMAMDWLDVARYADTHGFNNDAERSMWRWRDWVIESFNRNLPYNRFITEQLAGDLLPKPTLEQRIATGFGRNHVINSEGGIIDEEYRVEYVVDRVRTLGMAWMGLTLECARCHDHKYDPITQRDHYRLYAFFNNVPELGEDGRVSNAPPMIPAPTPPQQARLKELEAKVAALESKRWPKAKLSKEPGVALVRSAPRPDKAQMDPVDLNKRGAFTMSAWLNPDAADKDAPLLSAMDFARNPAATTYGNGIELRLVNGEIEFRFGQRFPAYSVRVQSEGAALGAGEWRHVAVEYAGNTQNPKAMRVYASWVRMFIDGREVPTRVINDGCQLPDVKGDKPTPTRFRIGWDNSPQGGRYLGAIEHIHVGPAGPASRFEERALPHARAQLALKKATPRELGWLQAAALRAQNPAYAKAESDLAAARAELLALRRDVPTVMVMAELETPRATHVLNRGAYNLPGERVEPGVPETLLGAWPEGAPKNRLGLAQWLTKPDHPLTARVVVNRFWQQLFGQGLVKTSENFGVQGDSPVHPELLDWLAREFIDSGWDVKALIKRIVLSETYRQDSAASKELIARDPENRLLARGPRFRLPAEVIRDQALAVAGLLSERLGGPSVFPAQPAGLYKGIVVAADYPGTSYVLSEGGDAHRRSLDTYWKRTVPHPTMTVFDAPDREFCIVRRSNTNTPLQALTLLNDPIFVEAARHLAQRALREGGSTPETRLAFAFRLATGRAPDAEDAAILRRTFDTLRAANPNDELAAYAALASVILNLDEVITKG